MSDLLDALGLGRPEWQERAACRGLAAREGGAARDALFFPARGESTRPAKAMCSDCPVVQECLGYALATGAKHGIWGNTSERDRRNLRKSRNAERRVAS